ncbi:MAG TPA: amidohydrolase family protein [Acetobacteraceae bacterium]
MTPPLAIDAHILDGTGFRPGTVLVAGGRIAGLGWTEPDRAALRARAGDRLDAGGCWLIPGLVDAHAHAYAAMLRGTESSLPLELWALYTTLYGRALDAAALRAAILVGAAERLRCGITAMVDHTPQVALAEAALAAHEESGLRVGYAPFLHDITDYELMGLPLPPALASMEHMAPFDAAAYEARFAAIVQQARAGSGRVLPLLGPNAPQRCSPLAWDVWRRLRDRHDVPVHTHLLETQAQRLAGMRWPGGTVAEMGRQGLLDGRLSVAHGIWLDEADSAILGRHGVTISHNPASNLMLGSGTMPYAAHRRHGVRLALGTDSANTGGRHDHFEAMRLAFMLHRGPGADLADWPTSADILAMATVNGAHVLGLGSEAGRIAEGCLADLVLVRRDDAATLLLADTLDGFVLHANTSAIEAVMIGGAWALRYGRILVFDEAAALAAAEALRAGILARSASGLPSVHAAIPMLARRLRSYLEGQ